MLCGLSPLCVMPPLLEVRLAQAVAIQTIGFPQTSYYRQLFLLIHNINNRPVDISTNCSVSIPQLA